MLCRNLISCSTTGVYLMFSFSWQEQYRWGRKTSVIVSHLEFKHFQHSSLLLLVFIALLLCSNLNFSLHKNYIYTCHGYTLNGYFSMFLWLVGFCIFMYMFGAHARVYVCRSHRLTSGVSLHNTLPYLPISWSLHRGASSLTLLQLCLPHHDGL